MADTIITDKESSELLEGFIRTFTNELTSYIRSALSGVILEELTSEQVVSD